MKKIISIFLVSVLVLSSCAFKKDVKTSSLPKKITIWNLFDDTNIFQGQIQTFVSKNPGVEIVYKKFVNIDDYEQLLINEIAEGRGPDIFAIKNTWLLKHKGKLSPLVVGSTKEPMNKDVYENTFLPVVSNDLISDGKIYGVSLYVDTLALYYNKQILGDIFASDKPGDTWQKIIEQVSRITRTDNSIEGFGVAGIGMGSSKNIVRVMDIFYLLMLQYGAKFIDSVSKKVTFANQQGTIDGTGEKNSPGEFALDLYSSFGKSSYKNYSWNDKMTAMYNESSEVYPFIQGKVAMIFGYSYLYEDMKSVISQFRSSNKVTILHKDIGIAEIPQINSFDKTTKRDALASYFPLVVSRNSSNPALAWDLLLYLSGKESLTDYYEKTHKTSSRIDLIDEQKLEQPYGVFARQSTYAKTYPDFVTDESSYNKVFVSLISDVINSKSSSNDALVQGQKIIQCFVDKFAKKESMYEIDCFKRK